MPDQAGLCVGLACPLEAAVQGGAAARSGGCRRGLRRRRRRRGAGRANSPTLPCLQKSKGPV
eukprot:6327190-Pyramimonas_sp.AAC.1